MGSFLSRVWEQLPVEVAVLAIIGLLRKLWPWVLYGSVCVVAAVLGWLSFLVRLPGWRLIVEGPGWPSERVESPLWVWVTWRLADGLDRGIAWLRREARRVAGRPALPALGTPVWHGRRMRMPESWRASVRSGVSV